jgi:hypothetical protein
VRAHALAGPRDMGGEYGLGRDLGVIEQPCSSGNRAC